ncbi:MAG: hypothetical protein HS130_07590 [Deltaproteobacteria bacterium]|nr:hypothetical protein [Deltaproteobacteria bacterium]MCL4873125.1 hypothetical protein [bacterium]
MEPVILYDNRLNDGTPEATSEATGTSVLNLRDLRTYTFWQAANTDEQTIIIDCGVPRPVDCLGIAGHNLGSIGATIDLQWCPNELWGGDRETVMSLTPENDKSILRCFTQEWKRHWRLRITGMSAAPKMAVLMFGQRLQFPYPPESPYIPFKESSEAETSRSKAGHALGSVIRYSPIEINTRFANLPRSFVFEEYAPFWEGHARRMNQFFYSWDLDEFPEDAFFVKMKDGATYQTPLSVLSLVDELVLDMEGTRE